MAAQILIKFLTADSIKPWRRYATVADLSMVAADQINQTPTIVFKGTRRKVAGLESYELLKAYLKEMMAQ